MASFGFRFSENYNYRLVEALNNYINWMNYTSSVLITIHDSVSTFNHQMNSLLKDDSYLNFNFSIPSSFEKIQESLKYFLGPTYFSKENTLIHQSNKEKNVTFAQLTEVCEKENSIIPQPASEEITQLFKNVKDQVEYLQENNQSIIAYLTSKMYKEDYDLKLTYAYTLIKNAEQIFDWYDISRKELEEKLKDTHLLHYQDNMTYSINDVCVFMDDCIISAREIMSSFRFSNSPNAIQVWVDSLRNEIADFDLNKDSILEKIKEMDIQHWEKDVPKDYLSSRYEMFMYRLKAFISIYEDFEKEDNSINTTIYFSKGYYFYNRKFFYAYKNDLISYYNSSLFASNYYFLKKTFEPMWFKIIDPRIKN